MASNLPWARNLKKNQLGGVIFGCTGKTMSECLTKQLFGLPGQHFLYVKNIEPGLPLFLFNYSDRKMHGIYEAASSGKMCIDSYAWTEDGSERTKYPAQVQIIARLQCQALVENVFKPIIIDNYYSASHFWFELDHAQASHLRSKLSSLAVSARIFIPKNPPIWKVAQKLPLANKQGEIRASEPSLADHAFDSRDSVGTSGISDEFMNLNGYNHLGESSLSDEMVEQNDKDLIYTKLKEMALGRDYTAANMTGFAVESASEDNVELDGQTQEDTMMTLKKTISENSLGSNDYPDDTIAKLCGEIEELKAFKRDQTCKMECLEKKLFEAEKEIRRLENRCMMLESSNPSMSLANEESFPKLNESILLVGGYDGSSWSSTMHSFSPLHDRLRSLKSMSFVRAYAAVAQLNKELYVFGGGTGVEWYDTVESYDIENNEWTLRHPLKTKNGCLAGAALNGKIFAVGGGNGSSCFSDVEMLDLDIGYWIPARSMQQKRFGLAAVELNGSLYAVGGYGGEDYLKSAERFDPREYSWTEIGSMEKKRGCHSLVVMNEKIYAIGGYDGNKMVANVEIYEPRVGTWMAGEPMNHSRGYLSAAVLNESIYVIGGVKEDEDIVETIECYKDGQGWRETKSSAVGKMCFATAIVLGEG